MAWLNRETALLADQLVVAVFALRTTNGVFADIRRGGGSAFDLRRESQVLRSVIPDKARETILEGGIRIAVEARGVAEADGQGGGICGDIRISRQAFVAFLVIWREDPFLP